MTGTTVSERWWHRLLRVLGYGFSLMVLSISLFVAVDDARYFTYAYSFEPAYAQSTGEESTCTSYESIKSISCGEFSDGASFLKHYVTVRGKQKIKDGSASVEKVVAELRNQGHDDDEIAVSIVGGKTSITFRRERHHDASKLLVNALSALGVTVGCFLSLILVYKIVLFVVHGHTRVARDS